MNVFFVATAPVHVVFDTTTDFLWWMEKIFLPLAMAILLFVLGIWTTRLTDKIKEYVRLEGVRQFLLSLLDGSILISLTRQMQDFLAKAAAFDIYESKSYDYQQRISVNLHSALSIPRNDIYDVFVRFHRGRQRLNSATMIGYLASVDTLADGLPARREVLSQIRQADFKTTTKLDEFRRRLRDARFEFQLKTNGLNAKEGEFNQQLPNFAEEPVRFDAKAEFFDQVYDLCYNTMPHTSEFYRPYILEILRASELCADQTRSVIRVRESVPRILSEDAIMCRSTRIALERARRHIQSPLVPVSYLHKAIRAVKSWFSDSKPELGLSDAMNGRRKRKQPAAPRLRNEGGER